MPSRPPNLPDFSRPPVTEVVLSIQFASLSKFTNAHVGLIWEKFRADYPKVVEQPPLQAVFETFGPPRLSARPGLQIETLIAPPMSRYWFEGVDETELIQLQQDRILHNWRKRQDRDEYPRFESIRSRFVSEVKILDSFFHQEEIGELRPNQCEVTYINTIKLDDDTNPHAALERITPLVTGHWPIKENVEIESAMLNCRYVLRDEDGKPFGRLYAVFSPALLTVDQSPVVRLEITGRGKPSADTVSDAFKLLDELRNHVVRMFAILTVGHLHQSWGRIR